MKDVEDYVIDLSDGKRIHGILRGEILPGKRLLLMVHGLTSSPYEVQFYEGAKLFYEHGLSSLSLFLYDDGDKYRDLEYASLEQNVKDIDEVIVQLAEQGVSEIYAIGHSYGGLALLMVKSKLDKAVLWDPSHGLTFSMRDRSGDEAGKFVVSGIGRGYFFPKSFNDYNQAVGDTSELAKNLSCPALIICAGESPLKENCKKYLENMRPGSDLVVIDGAPHNFKKNDRILGELHNQTLRWFNKPDYDKS